MQIIRSRNDLKFCLKLHNIVLQPYSSTREYPDGTTVIILNTDEY